MEGYIKGWDKTFEIKENFEKDMGCSIYDVLPDIGRTTLLSPPPWKIPVKWVIWNIDSIHSENYKSKNKSHWHILGTPSVYIFLDICNDTLTFWNLQICHITVMRLSLNYVMISPEIEIID